MRRPLRIYSETAPYAAVVDPAVLRALAARDLELVLAVRPWDLVDLPDTARRIVDAGIALSLWPMLGDADGRFLHVGNVARMSELSLRALEAARGRGGSVRDVMLDLEPPVEALRGVRKGALRPLLSAARRGLRLHAGASHAASVLRRRIQAESVSVSAAVTPDVLFGAHRKVSPYLGTVAAHEFEAIDVMAYTTLVTGYTRGLVPRRGAHSLLAEIARRAHARRHTRVALGCIGLGAMGDEPVFASPAELAHDVRVVRGAGAKELALLDLGGMLARPPLDAWLDAFCGE